VIAGTVITAEFAINEDGITGTMAGTAGCNDYNAAITGVFTTSLSSVTQQLCDQPAGIMDQEQIYLAALQASQALAFEPGTLTVTTGSGLLVYTSTPPNTAPPTPTTGAPATQPPGDGVTAVIIVNPESGTANAGQTITFDASSSTSNAELTQFSWDMGDGTLLEGNPINYDYQTPGDFVVQLTVVDAIGAVGQASTVYTVIP
jgi:plastocyanin